MCSMEVYQELNDNVLQFKFPAQVGVQRLGAAGWRTRSAKNMFIRHVLRHVEEIKRIARNPGGSGGFAAGAAWRARYRSLHVGAELEKRPLEREVVHSGGFYHPLRTTRTTRRSSVLPARLRCRAGAAGWRTRSAQPPPYDRMIRVIRMTRSTQVALVFSKCLGTENRHGPFFGCCPRGVPRGVQTLRELNIAPLSLEGVSQMAYILPERLLALVRPAFDLVLRRIRSLKRCVQVAAK